MPKQKNKKTSHKRIEKKIDRTHICEHCKKEFKCDWRETGPETQWGCKQTYPTCFDTSFQMRRGKLYYCQPCSIALDLPE